jgi:hypothetical protein
MMMIRLLAQIQTKHLSNGPVRQEDRCWAVLFYDAVTSVPIRALRSLKTPTAVRQQNRVMTSMGLGTVLARTSRYLAVSQLPVNVNDDLKKTYKYVFVARN